MDIVILQTADAHGYKRMLDATARTAIEYCRRHDLAYENYVGIKRGYFPWHATFNRVFQLTELVDRGFAGWAVYMDADAYIHDLDFDLRAYLSDKPHCAGIMTTIPGAPMPWAINAGVILLNLGQEQGRTIATRWRDRYMRIDDRRLRTMSIWDDGESDQSMLFDVLDEDAALRGAVHFDDGSVINSHGARFIRQLLRSLSPSLADRIIALQVLTDAIVDGGGPSPDDVPALIVSGLYRALLGRDPDPTGLRNYADHIRAGSLDEGTRYVASELASSAEYHARSVTGGR